MLRACRDVEPHAHNEPGRQDRAPQTDAAPDPILSGADAVEKTTYVGDVHGADAEERTTDRVPVTASVPSGGASPIAWIAGILAALALIAYAVAMFA